MKHLLLLTSILLLTLAGCKGDQATTKEPAPSGPAPAKIKIPKFNQDSAYAYVEKQLSFGTRVPGSPGHQAQLQWMVDVLEGRGAKVYQQDFEAQFFDEPAVTATNVIAAFNPKASKRWILAAHWDTRLVAEKDPDEAKQDKPIMGADDGASGVAVLMEIARLLEANPLDMGVDLIFFDAEDNGNQGDDLSWCLGSQYWSKKPHINNYDAEGGILVDLVGAKNNTYGYDRISQAYAPSLQNAVWRLARGMGNTDLFKEYQVEVLDDHYFVNHYAKIPMIDIIGTPSYGEGSVFGPHHHTHDDDLAVIDPRVLKVTGQVVTAVTYKFSEGSFVF
jgi:hypothetical protein